MLCPICFRLMSVDAKSKFTPHQHTPMMGELCPGGGKTPEEAKSFVSEEKARIRSNQSGLK